MLFGKKEFYPYFKDTWLHEAIKFAKEHVPNTRKYIEVIFHQRKSVLYNDGEPCVKESDSFDVTMGVYDGAEVCELITKNIGQYRDDRIAVFKNVSGPASFRKTNNNKKKQLQCFFKQNVLENNYRV